MMNLTEASAASGGVSPDFLPLVTQFGILSEPQLRDVRQKMQGGEYPAEPQPLAARLVADGYLTEFQARRILDGRPDGLIVGRYLVLDRIGSGGMGRVYKARHQMMGRTVALKLISTRLSNYRDRVERFRREMQIVGRLDHPNVVRAFDADRVGKLFYIAMEYVAGQSLEDLIAKRGRLPVPDAVYYASQAASGLQHAHERGVVHRDVKPSNILLTESRTVKILDLGLGVFLDRVEPADFKTQAGITVGTIDYLSPEQACSKPVDGRSDIFSLGCVLYHMITGRLPYAGDSSMERLAVRIVGQPVSITEVIPDLHPGVVRVVQRMMAHRPEERFQTCGEVADALRALIRPKAGSPSSAASRDAAAAGIPPATAQAAPPPEARSSETAAPAASAAPSVAVGTGAPPPTPASGPAPTATEPATEPAAVAPANPPEAPSPQAVPSPGRLVARVPVLGRMTPRHRMMAGVAALAVLAVIPLAVVLGRTGADRPDDGALPALLARQDRTGQVGLPPAGPPPNKQIPIEPPPPASPPAASTTATPPPAEPPPAEPPPAEPPPAEPTASEPPPADIADTATNRDPAAAGHDLALAGRWQEAASAFEAARRANPRDLSFIHRESIALLKAGKVEEYRRLCEEAVAAADGTTNVGAVDVIRAASLPPGVGFDPSWAIPLVESTVESDPGAGWRRFALGLALYRTGQVEAAIASFKESLRVDPGWAAAALNHCLLAMAYLRLDEHEEAVASLDRARAWDRLRDAANSEGASRPTQPPWWNHAEFDLFLQEAEALHSGGAPAQ